MTACFNPHLFVDISSHGFGHLAQAAPVLNELKRRLPGLRLTIRTGLPAEKLQTRVRGCYTHIADRSDFGFVMHDATRIDRAASAEAYRALHADWAQCVEREAAFLSDLAPDLVLTDVAYLPLAGAAKASIPALCMCSLNWADMFEHLYGAESWAAPIHQQILAAYNSAQSFLRFTPGMPMAALQNVINIAPVADLGADRRRELRARLQCAAEEKLVLVAYGGFEKQLPLENWPQTPGLHWLVSNKGALLRPDMSEIDACGMPFADLLHSVDAVLTKPGYGTFVEAACCATPLLYERREDWPEQEVLIAWLKGNARCAEVSQEQLLRGELAAPLHAVWRQPIPVKPYPAGIGEAAGIILARLRAGS